MTKPFLLPLVVLRQKDIPKIISRLDNGFRRKVSGRRMCVSYRMAALSIRQE